MFLLNDSSVDFAFSISDFHFRSRFWLFIFFTQHCIDHKTSAPSFQHRNGEHYQLPNNDNGYLFLTVKIQVIKQICVCSSTCTSAVSPLQLSQTKFQKYHEEKRSIEKTLHFIIDAKGPIESVYLNLSKTPKSFYTT